MPAPEEPASPDRERMDAISGALARLVQRQNELDQRLLRIEAAAGLGAAQTFATGDRTAASAADASTPAARDPAGLAGREHGDA